jgi:hypothetical protein
MLEDSDVAVSVKDNTMLEDSDLMDTVDAKDKFYVVMCCNIFLINYFFILNSCTNGCIRLNCARD